MRILKFSHFAWKSCESKFFPGLNFGLRLDPIYLPIYQSKFSGFLYFLVDVPVFCIMAPYVTELKSVQNFYEVIFIEIKRIYYTEFWTDFRV